MRKAVTALITAICLVAAAPAAAHSTWWYWSEPAAESALEDRFAGVYSAYCYGTGKSKRVRNGLRAYKHFDCNTEMADGSDEWGRFHVKGENRFRFFWR